MIITITVPTFARDLRPDDSVLHETMAWTVDTVTLERDNKVRVALAPIRAKDEPAGRRSIVTYEAETFVHKLPGYDHADALAAVIADTVGAAHAVYWSSGDDPETPIATERSGYEWRADTAQLVNCDPTPELVAMPDGGVLRREYLLDVFAALGGDLTEWEEWMADPRRTQADAWAQLLAAIRGDGFAGDSNPGPGWLRDVARRRRPMDVTDIAFCDLICEEIALTHPTFFADRNAQLERRSEAAQRRRDALLSKDWQNEPGGVEPTVEDRTGAPFGMGLSMDASQTVFRDQVAALTPDEIDELASANRGRLIEPDLNEDTLPGVMLAPNGTCPISKATAAHCTLPHVHIAPTAPL